jgi:hypothetical protein
MHSDAPQPKAAPPARPAESVANGGIRGVAPEQLEKQCYR